jgi:hypothetical protein
VAAVYRLRWLFSWSGCASGPVLAPGTSLGFGGRGVTHLLILICHAGPETGQPAAGMLFKLSVRLQVRHEARVFRLEVQDLRCPGHRSGWVKLAAVRSTGRWGGWEAAATKSGRSSTTGWIGPGERDGKAYERNRRLRPLHVWPALTRWMWAGTRCAPGRRVETAGELPGGS